MRILIVTILTLLSLTAMSQQPLWWGMNPKGQLMIYQVDGQSGTSSTTHNLTGVPAGSLLVVTVGGSDDLRDGSMNSSPSLTWTKRVEAEAGGSGEAEIWTATFTAGGSIEITSTLPSTSYQSSTVYVIVNSEDTPAGATAAEASQSAPNDDIVTTRAGSIIISVSADWNAVDGASRAYRFGCIEKNYYYESGFVTIYHYIRYAQGIASYKIGLSSPSTMSASTATIEIRKK